MLLLVPEQATFQTEQALVRRPDDRRIPARAQVLSFRRLAHRSVRSSPEGALPPLSERGRRMVLRALLSASSGRSSRCSAGLADRPRRGRRPRSQLSRRCGPTPEHRTSCVVLRRRRRPRTQGDARCSQPSSPTWRSSVSASRGTWRVATSTPDRYGELLARVDPGESMPSKGGEVWIDGFSGFTPVELDVVAALTRRQSERVSGHAVARWPGRARTLVSSTIPVGALSSLDRDPSRARSSARESEGVAARGTGDPRSSPVRTPRGASLVRRSSRHLERHVLPARAAPERSTGPVERVTVSSVSRRARVEVDAIAREVAEARPRRRRAISGDGRGRAGPRRLRAT